jgi:pyruvate carboxylase
MNAKRRRRRRRRRNEREREKICEGYWIRIAQSITYIICGTLEHLLHGPMEVVLGLSLL